MFDSFTSTLDVPFEVRLDSSKAHESIAQAPEEEAFYRKIDETLVQAVYSKYPSCQNLTSVVVTCLLTELPSSKDRRRVERNNHPPTIASVPCLSPPDYKRTQ